MIRTRNFRAPNERIETGVLVKRQKRKNVSVERETDINGKKMDSVQEEVAVKKRSDTGSLRRWWLKDVEKPTEYICASSATTSRWCSKASRG